MRAGAPARLIPNQHGSETMKLGVSDYDMVLVFHPCVGRKFPIFDGDADAEPGLVARALKKNMQRNGLDEAGGARHEAAGGRNGPTEFLDCRTGTWPRGVTRKMSDSTLELAKRNDPQSYANSADQGHNFGHLEKFRRCAHGDRIQADALLRIPSIRKANS
jgi:hypothetical protein